MTIEAQFERDFTDVFAPDKEKSWEVWTEGYKDTGSHESATFHGRYCGIKFQDALVRFRDSLECQKTEKLVNIRNGTFWGCRFFDNETDARKTFG